MAKMMKLKQTDFTRGGRDISNTAIPLYQNTLKTLDQYIQNPYETIDTILDRYYSNTSEQSDFLRNYKRAMANTSANNFASTGGGYSSSGQKAYNDNQRYWNDAMARLRDQGVANAANIQNAWFNQALQGAGAFHNAYNTGAEYSKIDQYNDIADQNNAFWNQFNIVNSQLMNQAGSVLQSIPNPWTQGIGAALKSGAIVEDSFIKDPTDALKMINPQGYAKQESGTAGNTSGWAQSLGQGLLGGIANGAWNNVFSKSGATPVTKASGGFSGSGFAIG